jgi:hypothetical protein
MLAYLLRSWEKTVTNIERRALEKTKKRSDLSEPLLADAVLSHPVTFPVGPKTSPLGAKQAEHKKRRKWAGTTHFSQTSSTT